MFLCDFPGGGEDLQQLAGFLVREQLQHLLLLGSSSGRSLLSLIFCSRFIYSFFFHCVYGAFEMHSTCVTEHPRHMWRPLYIVPRVRCRSSLTWMGWCSKDGRRWWRAAVPAPRRQITTKLMVWTPRRLCSSEPAFTDEKLGRKRCNYHNDCGKSRLQTCSTNRCHSARSPAPFWVIWKVLLGPVHTK